MLLLLRRSGSSQAILQSIREQPAKPPMYVVIHNIEGFGEMTKDRPQAACCPAFATCLAITQVRRHLLPHVSSACARHPGGNQRPVYCLRVWNILLAKPCKYALQGHEIEGAVCAGLREPEAAGTGVNKTDSLRLHQPVHESKPQSTGP